MLLPNGSKAWHLLALAYKEELGEDAVHDEENIAKIRLGSYVKLCNNFKKSTGVTGEKEDQILWCIELDKRIQHKTNSDILGVSSGEDDNLNDEEIGHGDIALNGEKSRIDSDYLDDPETELNKEVNNNNECQTPIPFLVKSYQPFLPTTY